jgi:hypothetical protein
MRMEMFLILYITIVVAVVGFLVSMALKYFGIELSGSFKELISKVPKAKEYNEKLKTIFEKINVAGFFKSIAASIKKANEGLKLAKNKQDVNRDSAAREDRSIPNENLKVAYSNIGGNLVNEAVVGESFRDNMKNMADYYVKPNEEPAQPAMEYRSETPRVFEAPRIINSQPVKSPSTNMSAIPYAMEKEKLQKEQEAEDKTLVEKLALEKHIKVEVGETVTKKQAKLKPSKKKKKYEIVQTGYASLFFSKSNNVTVIPYAKDIQGKGRAMDGIKYIQYPFMPDELGKALQSSLDIGDEVDPYSDKELMKELEVKEWEDFTLQKKHISVKYDKVCGYILNTTTRNPDGSYRLNCPGGIEKIVRKDASMEELGDTVIKLLDRCRA